MRQEFTKRRLDGFAVCVCEHDRHVVAAEFTQNLPANAAWRGRVFPGTHDRNRVE
jgi:hypothetical protein